MKITLKNREARTLDRLLADLEEEDEHENDKGEEAFEPFLSVKAKKRKGMRR